MGERRSTPYAIAIFLSSSMLFLIEPIAGKRILPLLGGSAAVWTACLVFFQCALLLGYLTAHWLVTRAHPRAQITVYLTLLALSLGQLVLAINPVLRATPTHPIVSVLWLLTVLIGIPFVTLSATSPLLQAWYARAQLEQIAADVSTTDGSVTEHAPSQAYRLYAVSNIGSLLALVVYPWLIEPRMSLHEQTAELVAGFALLAIVCAAIALSMRSSLPRTPTTLENDRPRESSTREHATGRSLWVALAACGSLLLSAVTNHISQNVATIPLLWIVPLIAYLLSFVVAFGGERWRPRWLMLGLAPIGLGSAGYLLYTGILHTPILIAASIFCGALFLICLFLHSELYRLRPPPDELTTFYFYIAGGGALGAILVGVAAPTVLPGNYELALGFCFTAVLGLIVTWTTGWFSRATWFATVGLAGFLVFIQVRADRVNSLVRVRNFYGTLHVTQFEDGELQAMSRTLYNGVISHGQQIFRADLHETPTTYYGPLSGVGLAIDLCCDNRPRRIGVIGLGAGTIAAYGRSGDVVRFYDINPAVVGISRRYFTYLRDSPARVDLVIGDARVSLESDPPQRFDVIAVDAFSGDAIPVHLINAQALDLYKRHLAPNGIVAFHVSNRYLDLKPVVAQLAAHAGMQSAYISNVGDDAKDVWSSDWVLVTNNESFLNQPGVASAREAVAIPKRLRLWTDDYNSLLPIFKTAR
jgi:SAM-dependent methyltransferase